MIKLLFCKSVLLKIIPELGDDGFIVILTFFPEWRPIPLNEIGPFMVFCLRIDMRNLYKNHDLIRKQQILR